MVPITNKHLEQPHLLTSMIVLNSVHILTSRDRVINKICTFFGLSECFQITHISKIFLLLALQATALLTFYKCNKILKLQQNSITVTQQYGSNVSYKVSYHHINEIPQFC